MAGWKHWEYFLESKHGRGLRRPDAERPRSTNVHGSAQAATAGGTRFRMYSVLGFLCFLEITASSSHGFEKSEMKSVLLFISILTALWAIFRCSDQALGRTTSMAQTCLWSRVCLMPCFASTLSRVTSLISVFNLQALCEFWDKARGDRFNTKLKEEKRIEAKLAIQQRANCVDFQLWCVCLTAVVPPVPWAYSLANRHWEGDDNFTKMWPVVTAFERDGHQIRPFFFSSQNI